MLIPIGTVKNVPVTIMRVSQAPPLVMDGVVTHFDGKRYQLTVTEPEEAFREGEQLLLDFGEGETGRRRTRVEAVSGSTITVNLLGRPRPPDRRFYPRIEGHVDVTYRVIAPDQRQKLKSWLERPHLGVADEIWTKPDPFMDFSVTGLRFRIAKPIEQGSWLAIRFSLPMMGKEVYYCGGEVVRIDGGDEGIFLAVGFVDISDEAVDALMEYTKRCQDLVLGLDSLYEE